MSLTKPTGNFSIEQRLPPFRQEWVHVGSRLDPRFGGIASSLPALCKATSDGHRNSSTIVGFCGPDECTKELQDSETPFVRLASGRVRWASHASLREELTRVLRQADGVHIHGLWDEHCSMTGTLASQLGVPYVVSAHGMLEKWAVGQKRLKKALYSTLIGRETLRRSSCLRALTTNEIEDYRRYGVHGPVAVIPNGVEAPTGIKSNLFLEQYPRLAGKRIVLFLGRIHPKKGVDTLCRAWCQICKQLDDVHLVLAGPNSSGMQNALRQTVEAGRVADRVTFTGMLNNAMKWSALAASSLFVLPSHSEGFSVAVLEALAVGVPVVISSHCNFPEVTKYFCGWETELTEKHLELTLANALTLAPQELQLIGSRGRQLVERNYSWSAVGSKMIEIHNWILFGTTPPTVRIH